MNTKVTIVMYHYVRDLKNSRFPEIKGLDINLFKGQIAYLKKHYNFITMEELIDAIDNKTSLPPKAVLLTFDDAYIDHYTHVFPVLVENNIQGSFYPPVKAITEHTVLDVNKIHFMLASCEDKAKLVKDIFNLLDKYRSEFNLQENDYYYKKLAVANRFDVAEVIFIKRVLQVELEERLRNRITNILFQQYIGISESAFSRELYMSIDQIKTLKKFGMHIGSHGYDHYWLSSLSKSAQENEIKKSLDFLKNIGVDIDSWTMCYPYGDYNDDTLSILSENGCKAGFCTNVNVADINIENRFTFSRLDTNDLPKDEYAGVNEFYKI